METLLVALATGIVGAGSAALKNWLGNKKKDFLQSITGVFDQAVKVAGPNASKVEVREIYDSLVFDTAERVGIEMTVARQKMAENVFNTAWDRYSRAVWRSSMEVLRARGAQAEKFADALLASVQTRTTSQDVKTPKPTPLGQQTEALREQARREGRR